MERMKLKRRRNQIQKHRTIIMVSLAVLLVFVGIGFSLIQSTLSMNGDTTINGGIWNVYFDNLTVTNGSMASDYPAKISDDKESIHFGVSFKDLAAFYEFTVDIVNNSIYPAKISDYAEIGLSTNTKYNSVLDFKVTYTDNGAAVKTGDTIAANQKRRIKVRVNVKSGVGASSIPIDDGIDLTVNIPFVQGP